MAATEKKYQLDTEENRQFLADFRENLFQFGHRFPAPGGSCYWLGDDGTPMPERNRDNYETCRMVHVYSIGQFLGHEGSTPLIDAGLKGIKGELHDSVHGGWYNSLAPDGSPYNMAWKAESETENIFFLHHIRLDGEAWDKAIDAESEFDPARADFAAQMEYGYGNPRHPNVSFVSDKVTDLLSGGMILMDGCWAKQEEAPAPEETDAQNET